MKCDPDGAFHGVFGPVTDDRAVSAERAVPLEYPDESSGSAPFREFERIRMDAFGVFVDEDRRLSMAAA